VMIAQWEEIANVVGRGWQHWIEGRRCNWQQGWRRWQCGQNEAAIVVSRSKCTPLLKHPLTAEFILEQCLP